MKSDGSIFLYLKNVRVEKHEMIYHVILEHEYPQETQDFIIALTTSKKRAHDFAEVLKVHTKKLAKDIW